MVSMQQIDELLDTAAARYPKELELQDGSSITLTPMVASDWQMVEEFLRATPEEEKRFFRHDDSDFERVRYWCEHLDYRHMFPLLAWKGKSVVADVVLERDAGLWTSHVGKLRILVRPSFRHGGIGRGLMNEVVELARGFDLHKLSYELASDQHELVSFLRSCGFREAALLERFIRDARGRFHDMVVMVRDLV